MFALSAQLSSSVTQSTELVLARRRSLSVVAAAGSPLLRPLKTGEQSRTSPGVAKFFRETMPSSFTDFAEIAVRNPASGL